MGISQTKQITMKTAMQFEWECIYCYNKFTAIEDIDGECPHCKEDYEWDFDGDYGEDSVWGIQWISTYPDPQKYRLLKNRNK